MVRSLKHFPEILGESCRGRPSLGSGRFGLNPILSATLEPSGRYPEAFLAPSLHPTFLIQVVRHFQDLINVEDQQIQNGTVDEKVER